VADCFKLIPVCQLEQARLVFPVLVLGVDPGPGEVAHELFDVLLEGSDKFIITGHDIVVLLDQDSGTCARAKMVCMKLMKLLLFDMRVMSPC
jgi:hypothetical protein